MHPNTPKNQDPTYHEREVGIKNFQNLRLNNTNQPFKNHP